VVLVNGVVKRILGFWRNILFKQTLPMLYSIGSVVSNTLKYFTQPVLASLGEIYTGIHDCYRVEFAKVLRWITNYTGRFRFNTFSNSIATKTIALAPKATKRSTAESGTTLKKLLMKGM